MGNSGYSHAYIASRWGILPYLTSFCEFYKLFKRKIWYAKANYWQNIVIFTSNNPKSPDFVYYYPFTVQSLRSP